MSKISVIILFLLFIIENISCQHIILKFKTNLDLNSLNEDNYIKSAAEQQIYVEFKIGESGQTIPMTLKTLKYPTYIVSSKSTEENILVKYDVTKSPNTFKYLNKDEIKNLFIYDFTQGYYSSDTLSFNSSFDYKNFEFILATKMNGKVKNISGEIGFSKKIENKNNYIYPQKTNFLQQLSANKLIRKKNFGIKYDSEYEGRLIIGANLKEIDSSYKDEQPNTIEIDNDIPNNNKDNWLFKFNIQQKEYKESSYGFFQYEIGLIFGSHKYYNNFIKNYFKSKGCSENKMNSSPYSFYHYICDDESQFSDFPDLNIGNFTFSKNDLFKKVGNKYFFLIIFHATQMEVNFWRLGQLFFKKYPIFLSEDVEGKNEQILYFNTNKEYEEKSGNLGLVISLSIIIPLIVIAGVAFAIYHFRKKKKAEELLKDEPESKTEDENYPIINNN